MIDKEKISNLARICEEKENIEQAHAMMNTPIKYEERIEAKAQYAIARAGAREAREVLEKAIRGEI